MTSRNKINAQPTIDSSRELEVPAAHPKTSTARAGDVKDDRTDVPAVRFAVGTPLALRSEERFAA